MPINEKKGEMGVGTLIVFIAMLLVAAVAAGVLIQTAGSLQEQSLSTGQQARSQISTNARAIEVSGTDGRNGNLTDFQEIIKLAPGSDPIKLTQVIFTFNTKDRTSTLKYRDTSDAICEKNNSAGYNTWNQELLGEIENHAGIDTASGYNIRHNAQTDIGVDLDDDGSADYVWVCVDQGVAGALYCPSPYNQSFHYLVFNLSANGLLYVPVINDDDSLANLSSVQPDSAINTTGLPIGAFGYIDAYRTSAANQYMIRTIDNPNPGAYFRIYENSLRLEEDYDDDGGDDFFSVNSTHAVLWLSSGQNLSLNLGANISEALHNISLSQNFDNGSVIATLGIDAVMTQTDYLPSGSVTITPYKLGEGYFSAIYEQDGTNHVEGNLQRGDIIRLCFESPGQITEDELVRLNFIPKIGTATLTQFVTPDVISTERVYLYP